MFLFLKVLELFVFIACLFERLGQFVHEFLCALVVADQQDACSAVISVSYLQSVRSSVTSCCSVKSNQDNGRYTNQMV